MQIAWKVINKFHPSDNKFFVRNGNNGAVKHLDKGAGIGVQIISGIRSAQNVLMVL